MSTKGLELITCLSLAVTLSVFTSLLFPLYQSIYIFSIKCIYIIYLSADRRPPELSLTMHSQPHDVCHGSVGSDPADVRGHCGRPQ